MTDQDIPIRKLYIDSRQRTSGSSHDFTVEIPMQLNFGKNVVAMVQDFCCPHAWWTVQAGVNDQLYWFERYMIMPNLPIQTAFHSTTIPQGVYDASSLAAAIGTGMTSDTSQAAGTAPTFTATYRPEQNNIRVVLTRGFVGTHQASFEIVPDSVLNWAPFRAVAGAIYPVGEPGSCNDLLGIVDDSMGAGDAARQRFLNSGDLQSSVDTGSVDMRALHTIFLHSSSFNLSTLTLTGSRTVIRKIPVTTSFGDILISEHANAHDYIDVGGRSLKRLDFRILDSRGKPVLLRSNAGVTFSLLFCDRPL